MAEIKKLQTVKHGDVAHLFYGEEIIASIRKKSISLYPWHYLATSRTPQGHEIAFCKRVTIFLQEFIPDCRVFVNGDRYGLESKTGITYSVETTTPEIQISLRK